MALLSANKLGVYVLRQTSVSQTSPMRVEVNSSLASAKSAVISADPADTIWFAVNSSDEWLEEGSSGVPNVYFYDNSEDSNTNLSGSMDLATVSVTNVGRRKCIAFCDPRRTSWPSRNIELHRVF